MKLVSIVERKQFRICKMQKRKNTKMQKVLNQFFLIDKENAYILQRKRRWQTENRGCASPAFSISYGQAKEMATHNGSHLSMYQASASISGDDKIFGATWESIFFHFTTLGDGNAREIGATREKNYPQSQ